MSAMKGKKLTPELRFPGFTGDWEEKRLGEIIEFVSTNSYSREKLNYEGGNIYNIHYGDIHKNFNSNFDITKELVPFLNEDITTNKNNLTFCEAGDLIIADASEDYNDIGKAIEIINTDKKLIVAGLHTLHGKVRIPTALGFKSYLMQSQKIRKQLQLLAQGISVLGISKGNAESLKLHLPTLPEQQKIADFLSSVDKKIELLQTQLKLQEEYKKGMMQKLFSQQIRFKDDNGMNFPDWEEKRLESLTYLITKQTGFDYSATIKPSLERTRTINNLPFIQNKDFNLKRINYNTDFYIPIAIQEKYPRITLDEKCILMTISGIIGNVGIFDNKEKAFIGGAVCILKFIHKELIDYVVHYLSSDIGQNIICKNEKSSSHKNITIEDIRKIPISLPSLSEQQKIADFLSSLDKKIDATKQQLEKAKSWKKGLMQQLFV